MSTPKPAKQVTPTSAAAEETRFLSYHTLYREVVPPPPPEPPAPAGGVSPSGKSRNAIRTRTRRYGATKTTPQGSATLKSQGK